MKKSTMKSIYKDLLDSQEELVCRWKPDATLTFVNQSYSRFAGIALAQLIGEKWSNLVSGEVLRGMQKIQRQLVRNPKKIRSEHRQLSSRGKWHWFEWVHTPLTNAQGKLMEVQSVGRDITQNILRLEKIEKTYFEEYRAIFNSSNDAIIIYDAKTGKVLDVNPKSCELYGGTRKQMVGKIIGNFSVGPLQTSRKFLFQRVRQAVQGEPQIFEWKIQRKNGEMRWVEMSMRAAQLSSRLCIIGSLRDISERKKTEALLREYRSWILDAQEQERRRVARELHDGVLQILGSIHFRVKSIISRMQDQRQCGKLIHDFNQTTKLIENTIHEVRHLSHVMRPSSLDELGFIAAIQELCREFKERTQMRVELRIRGYRTRKLRSEHKLSLFRIFQEALRNIERHSKATHVNVSIFVKDNKLLIQIKDDGIGFLVKKHLESKRGLGLIHIRERIEDLGGSLMIQSEHQIGTCLNMQIPIKTLQIPKLIGVGDHKNVP